MKMIGIASNQGMVAQHFGHCEVFEVYEVDQGKASKKEEIPNPGHRPGFLPGFLNEKGLNLIISEGMGQGAIDLFQSFQMGVITGAKGNCEDVAQQYAQGKLVQNKDACGHDHG